SATHVPFAKVAGCITGSFEGAGQGRRRGNEKVGLLAAAVARAGLEKAGDVPARREHARRGADTRRRANWGGAVILREADPLLGQAVDVRRGRKPAPIAADVPVAHI